MAAYNRAEFLRFSNDERFDRTYGPGEAVPLSGIYRCDGCGHEISCNAGDPFPPQNHHQHKPVSAIRWRLIVARD